MRLEDGHYYEDTNGEVHGVRRSDVMGNYFKTLLSAGTVYDSSFHEGWTADGIPLNPSTTPQLVKEVMFVDIPAPVKHVEYFNVWGVEPIAGTPLRRLFFTSREQADAAMGPLIADGETRIACVKVEYEEGQFDD